MTTLTEAVRRTIESYAQSYDTMNRVDCRSVAQDLRANIIPQVLALLAEPAAPQEEPSDEEIRELVADWDDCKTMQDCIGFARAVLALRTAPVAEPAVSGARDAWALLREAWNYGQFADDFDYPLVKPLRAAIRTVIAASVPPQPETCKGDPGDCAHNGACMYACGGTPPQPKVRQCEWTNCIHRVGDVCCNDRKEPPQPVAQGKYPPYCLFCEKEGHRSNECQSTHTVNARTDEIHRVVFPQPAAPSAQGFTDGGRNMFYEGRFEGETAREQEARLRWADDMRAAFERHTGNGWFDKDWNREAGLWKTAWDACLDADRAARSQPVAQGPDAYVPIHPRTGPLWMDVYPAGMDVSQSRPKNYPVRALYFDADRAARSNLQVGGDMPSGLEYANARSMAVTTEWVRGWNACRKFAAAPSSTGSEKP